MKLHLPLPLRSALLAVCVLTGMSYFTVAADSDPSTTDSSESSDPSDNVRDSTTLTWKGSTEANWQNGEGGDNWSADGVNDTNFYEGDKVIFDIKDNNTEITIIGTVSPGDMDVTVDQSITLTFEEGTDGTIAGKGILTKNGDGTLIINTENSYTGGTKLIAGTLQAGSAKAFGTGDITISAGTLNMGGNKLANTVIVTANATIDNGDNFVGTLQMQDGTLSGNKALNLETDKNTFTKGTISVGLTGKGSLKVETEEEDGVSITSAVELGQLTLAKGTLTLDTSFSGTLQANKDTKLILGKDFVFTTPSGGEATNVSISSATLVISNEEGLVLGEKIQMTLDGSVVEATGNDSAKISITSPDATLILKGASLDKAEITLSGGTLKITGSDQEFTNLTLSGGELDLRDGKWATVTGELNLKGSTNIVVDSNDLKGTSDEDPLYVIKGKVASGNEDNITFDALEGARSEHGVDDEGVWVYLDTREQSWNGDANSVWKVGEGEVWNNGTSADTFYNLDDVIFNNVSTETTIQIEGEVNPGSITVNNDKDLTFASVDTTNGAEAGQIVGKGKLVKDGEGDLIIANKNDAYEGAVEINKGGLKIGTGANLGTASITFNNGSTFDGGGNDIGNSLIFNGESSFSNIGSVKNITLGENSAITGDKLTIGEKDTLTVAGTGDRSISIDDQNGSSGLVFENGSIVHFDKDGTLILEEKATFMGESSTTTIRLTTNIQYSTTYTLIVFKDGAQRQYEETKENPNHDPGDPNSEETITETKIENLEDILSRFKLEFQGDPEMLDYATLYYEDGKLMLAMGRPPTPEEIAQTLTKNQRSAYWALRTIAGTGGAPGLLGQLAMEVAGSKKPNVVRELVEKLDGSELASAMSSQIEGNMAHMRRLRAHIGTGQFVDPREGTLAAYVKLFNDNHRLKEDANGLGHKRTVTGGIFGMETMLKKNMLAGVALSDGRARIKPTNSAPTNYEDTSRMDAYLAVNLANGWQSVTTFGVGFHSFTYDRAITDSVHSRINSMDGTSVNFSQEVAYTFSVTETSSARVFFSVLSSMNKIAAFEEEGAGTASLAGDSRSAWATDVMLGVRFIRAFRVIHNLPEATLSMQTGVVASIGKTTADLNMHFIGAPDVNFAITDAETKRLGYHVGADVQVPIAPGAALSASVGAVLRGGSHEASASMGMWFTF